MIDVFKETSLFNQQVCGLVTPASPVRLNSDRKQWTVTALMEEIHEFKTADNIVEEVDALIDLIYFAAGRMQEMGVDGARAFAEVQAANMRKVQGALSKRPGSQGHDAVKPEGWKGPDYTWLVHASYSLVKQIRVGNTVRHKQPGSVVELWTSNHKSILL